jgi:hypothetical protein
MLKEIKNKKGVVQMLSKSNSIQTDEDEEALLTVLDLKKIDKFPNEDINPISMYP